MSLWEYFNAVNAGVFTDGDGYAYAAIGEKVIETPILPSQCVKLPLETTHILWFKK